MTAYWLYCRIDVHVGRSDEQVLARLRGWADGEDGAGTGLIGGRGTLTKAVEDAVLAEHHQARRSYCDLMGGRL